MCGIFGFIGKSKDPLTSWKIADALMQKTEHRGTDATGFWASEHNGNQIFFDKEAVKSSIYHTRAIWNETFKNSNCDILLGHCRQCSANVGNEKCNRNNHPHVSLDKKTALIHNGQISEYNHLKGRYQLFGECDSEILLAMYQTGWNFRGQDDVLAKEVEEIYKISPNLAFRAMGLMEIFKYVHHAKVAMAIGERGDDGERFIWLNRDNERPLHVVDLRETLGQVFFFSTVEIWKNAVGLLDEETKNKYIPKLHEIGVFPADELWLLRTVPDDQGEDVWNITKFKISRTKYTEYDTEKDDPPQPYRRPDPENDVVVVSRLNEKEEVVGQEPVVAEEKKKEANIRS